MFGTLRPQGCQLSDTERQAHRRLYCGLCQGLGEGYGTITRALVSFDAVFLAVLAEGLSDAPAADSSCRCPLVPVVFRPTAAPDSPPMRFAAAVSLLLADQWVADKALDDSALAAWVRPLGTGSVARARHALAGLGIDLGTLDGFEHHQKDTERRGATTPAAAAAPTAEALRLVFSQIAALPGVTADADADALGALGAAIGEIIYTIDALEDLEQDALGGAFNPCLDADGHIDAHRVAMTAALLQDALDRAAAQVAALPLQRHRALVEDIALRRQEAAARQATEAAERAAAAVARRRAMSPARRAAWAVATVVLSFLFWLESSSVAFAGSLDFLRRIQEDTGEPPPPPPGSGGGGGGSGNICADLLDCFRCCVESPKRCGDGITDCQVPCSKCGQFCEGCQNCPRTCDNCGKACQGGGDCCRGCSDCGQACQNCN